MKVDRIDPARTAMIVVDMQNDFVAAGAAMETPAARAMVPKLAEALRICRSAGIRVIYTAHVHRRDGSDMGLFDGMHPPIATGLRWSMERLASRSIRNSPRSRASMSSGSTATAASLVL